MDLYYLIVFFIFGTIFGSFYNVVGTRLPNNKSIVKPPSHCDKCKKNLKFYELIPVISYLIQRGKCRNCKTKLSPKYLIYEIFTGLCFMACYLSFGFNLKLLLALTFVSGLIIVIISDIDYYIILDEVLIVTGILILIQMLFIYNYQTVLLHLLSGVCAFLAMYSVKIFGDLVFKKESMGGGDIKLLFLIGFVIGFKMAVVTIFLGSIIAFPVSLCILKFKKSNIIAFGPYLSLAAMIIFLFQLDFNKLIEILSFV